MKRNILAIIIIIWIINDFHSYRGYFAGGAFEDYINSHTIDGFGPKGLLFYLKVAFPMLLIMSSFIKKINLSKVKKAKEEAKNKARLEKERKEAAKEEAKNKARLEKEMKEAAKDELIRKEIEKRERTIKWLNENNIDNPNVRNKVKNGDISLEKAIQDQSNYNIKKREEEEEKNRRIKILNDNKITDEITRNSFVSDRYDIKTAILKQEILNKREKHKEEMNEVIKSYKFYSSQTYVLSKEKFDLYNISKKNLIDRCNRIKNLGVDICNAIKHSRVIQGMEKEVVLLSLGKPGDVDETVYKTKTKAYYYYHPYKTRQKRIRYKFRVDLENDIVVGWKDLD